MTRLQHSPSCPTVPGAALAVARRVASRPAAAQPCSAGKGLLADLLRFDLGRIEVHRGPQGALCGSGSLGVALRHDC